MEDPKWVASVPSDKTLFAQTSLPLQLLIKHTRVCLHSGVFVACSLRCMVVPGYISNLPQILRFADYLFLRTCLWIGLF